MKTFQLTLDVFEIEN